jgi:hypothetical protein
MASPIKTQVKFIILLTATKGEIMKVLHKLEKDFLRERFVEHTHQGVIPVTAMYYAIIDAGLELLRMMKSDPNLVDDSVEQIIYRTSSPLPSLLSHGLPQELGNEYTNRKKLPADPLIFGFIITVGGGTQDIPDPACIEAHLPKNRNPTEEDIRNAWEACKA